MKVSIFAIPKDSKKPNNILLLAPMKWEEIQELEFLIGGG
jgi:hypothetical protein